MKRAFTFPLLCSGAVNTQSARVLKFDEGREFRTGHAVPKRIVHPEMEARQITLDYSSMAVGQEFSQHVHDNSDDTVVYLEGQADLLQGDSRCHLKAGQIVFVPVAQIHGITTMENGGEMISSKTLSDMSFTRGAHDSPGRWFFKRHLSLLASGNCNCTSPFSQSTARGDVDSRRPHFGRERQPNSEVNWRDAGRSQYRRDDDDDGRLLSGARTSTVARIERVNRGANPAL